MLAAQLIPAIRRRLSQLDGDRGDPLRSGRRAAFWRAQQHAAHRGRTLDELRRYCLDELAPRHLDEAHENDYLRGYREGLQAVLAEIRSLETRPRGRR